MLATSCSLDGSASGNPPNTLAYSQETVDNVEQLWLDAGATETLAICYSAALRDAGALAEPVNTMSDLVEAHDSMSLEDQATLHLCLEAEKGPPESAETEAQPSN